MAFSHRPGTKKLAGRTAYEQDPYAWSLEQSELLKAGRLDEIDAENIREEILDVGRNEYDELESALRVLLAHMLKWNYQPEKRSRSWEATIAIQRRHALRQVEENPSLKSRLEEALREGYSDARLLASGETDMDLQEFPEACPYSWDDIMSRPFER
jgi:hypothetical protein